jgi:hypothetical protein
VNNIYRDEDKRRGRIGKGQKPMWEWIKKRDFAGEIPFFLNQKVLY